MLKQAIQTTFESYRELSRSFCRAFKEPEQFDILKYYVIRIGGLLCFIWLMSAYLKNLDQVPEVRYDMIARNINFFNFDEAQLRYNLIADEMKNTTEIGGQFSHFRKVTLYLFEKTDTETKTKTETDTDTDTDIKTDNNSISVLPMVQRTVSPIFPIISALTGINTQTEVDRQIVTTINAQNAVQNRKTDDILLTGQVRVKNQSGQTMFTEKLRYFQRDNSYVSDSRGAVFRNNIRLGANHIEYYENRNRGFARGNVRITIQPTKK